MLLTVSPYLPLVYYTTGWQTLKLSCVIDGITLPTIVLSSSRLEIGERDGDNHFHFHKQIDVIQH